MAKINATSLQKMAERAEQIAKLRHSKALAKEKKYIEKKARPRAQEIIKSLPSLLRKEARRGGNYITVLNSSSVGDERLFKEISHQVSTYCWKEESNLDVHIQKHEPVGMDDYPYYETLVVGFRK